MCVNVSEMQLPDDEIRVALQVSLVLLLLEIGAWLLSIGGT
jgi:hypothetical protein